MAFEVGYIEIKSAIFKNRTEVIYTERIALFYFISFHFNSIYLCVAPYHYIEVLILLRSDT